MQELAKRIVFFSWSCFFALFAAVEIMGLETEFKAIYRMVPRILLITAFLHMLVDFSWTSIIFLCGILAAELLTLGFKKISPKGSRWAWTERPDGARDCGVVAGCITEPGAGTGTGTRTKGTVSGHSAVAAFAATYWIINILSRYDEGQDQDPDKARDQGGLWRGRPSLSTKHVLQAAALSAVALTVLASRLMFSCHKKIQVLLGSVLGVGLGFSGWRLKEYLEMNGPTAFKSPCVSTCPVTRF